MFLRCLIIVLSVGVARLALADTGEFVQFGWTLSASPTDPLVNTGPATSDTLDLYLWMYCSEPVQSGVSAAKFSLEFHPSLWVHTLELSPGVTNSGTVWDLDLQLSGCPPGAHRVAHYRIQDLDGIFWVCLGPNPNTGENTSSGCASPNDPGENALMGYAAGLKVPCSEHGIFFDNLCYPTVSVSAESWSKLKGRYRASE